MAQSSLFMGINKNLHAENPVPDSLDLHIATTSTDTITFHVEGTNGVFYTGTVALDSSTNVNLNLNLTMLLVTFHTLIVTRVPVFVCTQRMEA